MSGTRCMALGALAASLGCGRLEFDAQPRASLVDADVADASRDALTPDAASDDPALALYLPFEGNVADATPYNAAVQCAVCPTYAPGQVGMAAVFGGTTCVQLLGGAARFQAPQFTIAAWFRVDVATGQTLLGKTYDPMTTALNSWELRTDSAPTLAFATTDGASNLGVAGGLLPLATWEHAAATYDGAMKRIYRNGVEVTAQASAATVFDNGLLMFGCDRDMGANVNHFTGMLDEIRVYERALAAAEIAVLAQ